MIKSITQVKVSGRRVLLRAGFDVPLEKKTYTEKMQVVDDTRIRDILPTLNYLIEHKAKIVLTAHLGRPDGWDESKSLWPVAEKLGELLNYKVIKITDSIPNYDVPHIYFLSKDITKKDLSLLSKQIKNSDILFLENVRFYKGEEDAHETLAKTLAKYGDVFVNDAFSVSHRKEASTYEIAKLLPSFAGISLMKEIQALNRILRNPEEPFVVIIGGAKIDDKVGTITNLAKHASHILIGGALANGFLRAKGYEVGKSEAGDIAVCKELLRNYRDKIVLPIDVVVAKSKDDQASAVDIDKVKPSDTIFDIGPKSMRLFADYVKSAKTLVWNGPLGLIEERRFAFGSKSMANVFAQRAKGPAFGVIGGGETNEVVNQTHVAKFIDHVSMGGGAMLEYLSGKKLPAIKVLEN
jgi:phosphoglycerate kinase